jgi:hypothetical protein
MTWFPPKPPDPADWRRKAEQQLRRGDILEVNLAGANLLGVDRDSLVNRRFASFLRGADLAVFTDFLQKGLANQDHPSCEVAVESGHSAPVWVCLQGAGSADGKVLPLAALDITRHRLARERLERLNRELEGRAGFHAAQLEGLCGDLEAIRHAVDTTLERTRRALDQGPPGI